MSFELFYGPGSCAFAAIVALEEVRAEYRLSRLDLGRGDQRSGAYLAINPLGRVPALRDDMTVVTELIAILTYVGARFPASGLLPSDPRGLARTYELLSWFSSSFHAAIAQTFRGERFSEDPDVQTRLKAPARRAFIEQLDRLETLYREMPGDGLVGGRFGLADAFALVIWRWVAKLEIDSSSYPNMARGVAEQSERPSVKRATVAEIAGPLWLTGAAAAH